MKNFSLSRFERVKKKKDFDKVYSSPKVIFSSDQLLKSFYKIETENLFCGIRIAAAVSKNMGKAVWRNRVKRLIKESYRLNKQNLLTTALEKKIGIFIVISTYKLSENRNKKIELANILPSVIDILEKIKQQIDY